MNFNKFPLNLIDVFVVVARFTEMLFNIEILITMKVIK